MNMRQHKRWVMARQMDAWLFVRLGRRMLARDAQRLMNLAALVEEPVPEVLRYQCVKVNSGEVVGTYYTRDEALSLVQKHARQKKARLQVVDTVTGELEVFSEEEMA